MAETKGRPVLRVREPQIRAQIPQAPGTRAQAPARPATGNPKPETGNWEPGSPHAPARPANPFRRVAGGDELIGFRQVAERLQARMEQALAGRNQAMLLEGIRGTGKSKILRRLSARGWREGMVCLSVALHEGDDEKAVGRKINEQVRVVAQQKGWMLKPWRTGAGTHTETRTDRSTRSGPVNRISQVNRISRINRIEHAFSGNPVRGFLVLLDDMDRMETNGHLLRKWNHELHLPHRMGWMIVASGMRLPKTDGFELIRMELLGSEEAEHFLTQALERTGIRWGQEGLRLLLHDSGANPGIFLAIASLLYDRLSPEEKTIAKAQYMQNAAAIRQEMAPLFDELYYRTSAQERNILRALARKEPLHVSGLARELRMPLNRITRWTLRLLHKGSLIRLERGCYRLLAPLYGRYVLSR